MSDINKITAAIAALVNALPGTSNPCTDVSLHGSDAARFRAIVDAGGIVRTYQTDAGTDEWDSVTLEVGDVCIRAYSEHRRIVRRDTDAATVEAALAQAQEALS